MAEWLRERASRIADEWAAEIRVRETGHLVIAEEVVDRQVLHLSGLLPWLLGPEAADVQPLWLRACELFGTVAAKRGLAAGEVIEEFQILRALLIRDLYRNPPSGGAPTLREALRLNGIIDRGVTHASVGHTDTMFFQLLDERTEEASGTKAERIALEVDDQLASIRRETDAILGKGAKLSEA